MGGGVRTPSMSGSYRKMLIVSRVSDFNCTTSESPDNKVCTCDGLSPIQPKGNNIHIKFSEVSLGTYYNGGTYACMMRAYRTGDMTSSVHITLKLKYEYYVNDGKSTASDSLTISGNWQQNITNPTQFGQLGFTLPDNRQLAKIWIDNTDNSIFQFTDTQDTYTYEITYKEFKQDPPVKKEYYKHAIWVEGDTLHIKNISEYPTEVFTHLGINASWSIMLGYKNNIGGFSDTESYGADKLLEQGEEITRKMKSSWSANYYIGLYIVGWSNVDQYWNKNGTVRYQSGGVDKIS